MWMGGQHHNLAAVLLGTKGTICIEGRVGPRPGLVGVKILAPHWDRLSRLSIP